MTRKASIHFQPVTNASFAVSHSERTDLSEPAYLLPKEYQLGNQVIDGSLPEVDIALMFARAKDAMTGQAKARGSSPFWEGVVVLSNTDSQEQSEHLQGWKKAYEKVTGHKVLHMSVHLDEGYIDTDGKPQYNPHAHVIVNRMDSKNRVISLDRKQLAAVQDLTAETLQMERGSTLAERQGRRGRKHVPHREFRAQADATRLELDGFKAVNTEELDKVKASRDKYKKLFVADTPLINELKKDIQTAESEVSKKAARIARLTELKEGYKRDRAKLKESGIATQKDYQALKIKHETDLAKLEADLKTAKTEAAKVPELVAQAVRAQAQIDKLTPEAAKVPGLQAQALELAQLKESIAARLKPVAINPLSRYHPDNIAKREAEEAAKAAAKPAPMVMPKIESRAAERVRPVAPQPKPTPKQEAEAQKTQNSAESASMPMGDQVQVFDLTLNKLTKIRQEKLNRVSVKLLKRQERRQKALQAVLNSRPPEPTGMLAALKRGAYDKAMDALEPIYQRAKKLTKQAEQVLQKVSEAAKQTHSWAYAKLNKVDPGLMQRVEAHRRDKRLDASRRQQEERDAQKALKGPDKGISR